MFHGVHELAIQKRIAPWRDADPFQNFQVKRSKFQLYNNAITPNVVIPMTDGAKRSMMGL